MDIEDEEDDDWGGVDDAMEDDDDDGTLPPNDVEDVSQEDPAFAELLAAAADGGEMTEEQAFRLALALSIYPNGDQEHPPQQPNDVPPQVPRFAWGSGNSLEQQVSDQQIRNSIGAVSTDIESDDLKSPEKPVSLISQHNSSQLSPRLTVYLLDGLVENLRNVQNLNCIHCIPTLKMLYSLVRNANCEDIAVGRSVANCLQTLGLSFTTTPCGQSRFTDFQLLTARFLSALFAIATSSKQNGNLLSQVIFNGIKSFLPGILQQISTQLNFHFLQPQTREMRSNSISDSSSTSKTKSNDHLKLLPNAHYDLAPFVENLQVGTSSIHNLFKDYDMSLVDSCLRFLSRLKPFLDKQTLSPQSSEQLFHTEEWASLLCSLIQCKQLQTSQRQIRRVLQQILGGPDEYRNFRDINELESTLDNLTNLLGVQNQQQLPYDKLLEVCENLKHCVEVASGRPDGMSRLFHRRSDLLVNILKLCSQVSTEEIRFALLQLLETVFKQKNGDEMNSLVELTFEITPNQVLTDFLFVVLLGSNSSQTRWIGHDVSLHMSKYANQHFDQFLRNLEQIFRRHPHSGMRSAQIIDLFGFLLLSHSKSSQNQDLLRSSLEFTCQSLDKAIVGIKQHPNAGIYSRLATAIGGLNAGFYLETAQCNSCANFQEVPFAQVKLQSLKSDAKFTSVSQTFKLSGGSHQISSIQFKFIDIKRHRMIKTINMYYNNRYSVPLVDLKGRPQLWQRAKTIPLDRLQSDVKVDFLVPITAGNLMFEITEFYENKPQASSASAPEVVQCPRCSNVVTNSGGVCSNCGENVFQCHKCRAIHLLYDERDPFMCASCGYSKYVKIETLVTCRPSSQVEPIENDSDYEKTVSNVDALLEKIDNAYQQMNSYRNATVQLLDKLGGREELIKNEGESDNANQVNPVIQQLVSRYTHDCRQTAVELSRLGEKLRSSRMEMLGYEARRHNIAITPQSPSKLSPQLPLQQLNLCFSCLTSSVSHSLALLRAFALSDCGRWLLAGYVHQLVPQLLDLSATSASNKIRADSRAILSVLTALYPDAARGLSNAISSEASAWLTKGAPPDDVPFIRSSVQMLASSALRNDPSWETYFRTAAQLFVEATQRPILSPFIWEAIMLPILEMYNEMLKAAAEKPEKLNGKSSSRRSVIQPQQQQQTQQNEQRAGLVASQNVSDGLVADVYSWLAGNPRVQFQSWRKSQLAASAASTKTPWQDGVKRALSLRSKNESARSKYLMEKYISLWRLSVIRKTGCPLLNLHLEQVASIPLLSPWVRSALFCPYSASVRQMICQVLESMVTVAPLHLRRCHILAFLTPCLDDVIQSEAVAEQFCQLYKKLIQQPNWRLYVAVKGCLSRIFKLVDFEIQKLTDTEQQAIQMTFGGSDASYGNGLGSVSLTRGLGLGNLVDILSILLEIDQIRNRHKKESVSLLLRGYLALKRLVASRTRAIDKTQQAMLQLMDKLTGNLDSDRQELADICISTVKHMSLDDYKSPAYVFERLCEIIYPEEKQKDDFLMIIEKCPEQEEFLQGRMLGNPYKSSDSGLGPLMRDIKNKICHDCELIALLEDENSMELLIRNKIINLALPVKDVYRRVWLAEAGPKANPSEPMRIVYRMRGLLGDATEDVVEELPPLDADVDKEERFKMAALMAGHSGGLAVVLERLASIENIAAGKPLLLNAVKLLKYCVNVGVNRRKLTDPNLGSVSSLLTALTRCLEAESKEQVQGNQPNTPRGGQSRPENSLSQELCKLIETILSEAAQLPSVEHAAFAKTCATTEQIEQLLQFAVTSVRANSVVLHSMMNILPYLALGNPECMSVLIKFFRPYCAAFSRLDQDRSADDSLIVDCFSTVVQNIDVGEYGSHLKDLIVAEGILGMAVEYIQLHTPTVKWAADSSEWRELSARPAVPFVLRILGGLVKGHCDSQLFVAEHCLKQLHQLEQACSTNNIGPLAEGVLDAMVDTEKAKKAVTDIRDATKQEKKRLAMNRRKKQLEELGMAADKEGKLRVTSTPKASIQGAALIKEEPGLSCCICREGYQSSPTRLLAIYTFTRFATLEEFDPRGYPGVATASSMVCVHIDCHDSAVASHARSTGGQADWTLAQLHNAGARCNGLLPTHGPQVSDQHFSLAFQRYNMNVCSVAALSMSQSGGWCYTLVVHDVKHLLLQVANQKPFSADLGGGGRETNLQLVPYLLYLALYAIVHHESPQNREQLVMNFLEQNSSKWVSSAYDSEGPFYYSVLALLMIESDQWKVIRMPLLRRILIAAHARQMSPNQSIDSLGPGDRQVYSFDIYKPSLLFFSLCDAIYTTLWPRLPSKPSWPECLADFIRKSDAILLKNCGKLLAHFDSDLVPAELEEFADLLDMHEEMPDPVAFLKETISSAP